MFYSLLIGSCYLFSRKLRDVFYFLKPNQIIKWSGLKRTYNLCIHVVKKPKLEISGRHRYEAGKGGGLGASLPQKPQNFKESKLPMGLSSTMVSYVKKT